DPGAWDFLRQEVIPTIIANKISDEPIRAWSAGCASGEEAYTLAICLAEALGPDDFRDRAKIYATDVDDDALNQARHASYTPKDLEGVPADLRDKYFTNAGSRHVFRADLRRSVIFGRHDLVQDPPISRIDLLACRNTLMYMNAETQSRILARLHFALSDSGYMFLGKAEMLLTHGDLFRQLDVKHRIFVKASRATLRDRLLTMALAGDNDAINNLNRFQRLREASFERSDGAQIVVDAGGTLVLANDSARALFGISGQDI